MTFADQVRNGTLNEENWEEAFENEVSDWHHALGPGELTDYLGLPWGIYSLIVECNFKSFDEMKRVLRASDYPGRLPSNPEGSK